MLSSIRSAASRIRMALATSTRKWCRSHLVLKSFLERIKNGESPYTPPGESRANSKGSRGGSQDPKKDGGKGGKSGGKGGKGRERSTKRSTSQKPVKTYGITWKQVCEEKHWCLQYCFGQCTKTEGTKGHDQLHHVERDIVKKEVEKRREAAKANGVKPDGTGG